MSSLYPTAKEGMLRGEIVWKEGGSVIKAALVRGYTYSSAHKFVSDVLGAGGTLVQSETLLSLTNTLGVMDAADGVWEAVPEGAVIPHVIIYQASAVTGGSDLAASQQRLIFWIDKAAGLPALPNGENVNVSWSPGADRIGSL
jgi:hypothetical protein